MSKKTDNVVEKVKVALDDALDSCNIKETAVVLEKLIVTIGIQFAQVRADMADDQ